MFIKLTYRAFHSFILYGLLFLGSNFLLVQTAKGTEFIQESNEFIRWRLNLGVEAFAPHCGENILYLPVTLSPFDDTSQTGFIPVSEAILAVNITTGEPLWAYRTERPCISVIGRVGNSLYLSAGGAGFLFLDRPNLLVVIDAISGQAIWSRVAYDEPGYDEIRSGYVIRQEGGVHNLFAGMLSSKGNKKRIIQDDIEPKLICLDPQKGQELWRLYLDQVDGPGGDENALFTYAGWVDYAVIGNVMFVSTKPYIAAIEVNSGLKIWVNKEDGFNIFGETKPIIMGDNGYFGGNAITALKLQTGDRVWNWGLGRNMRAQMIGVREGKLFAALDYRKKMGDDSYSDSTSSLVALSVSSGQLLWEINIGSKLKEWSFGQEVLAIKTEEDFRVVDLERGTTGMMGSSVDTWLLPNGSAVITGGVDDGVIAVKDTRANPLTTLDLGSAIKKVFRCGDLLILVLRSREIVALDDKDYAKYNESQSVPFNSAKEILSNLKPSPLPSMVPMTDTPIDSTLQPAVQLLARASILQDEGQFQKAEPVARDALRLLEEQHVIETNAILIASLHLLASILEDLGNQTEAEVFYRRILNVTEKNLNSTIENVASSMRNFAGLLSNKRKFKEAEHINDIVLEIYQRQYGVDHIEVAKSLSAMALVLLAQKKYEMADTCFRKALKFGEEKFEYDDPEIGELLNSLSSYYFLQKNYALAEPLLRRSLNIIESEFGQNDYRLAEILFNFGLLSHAQNKHYEAELFFGRSYEIFKLRFGQDHPNSKAAKTALSYEQLFRRKISILNAGILLVGGRSQVCTDGCGELSTFVTVGGFVEVFLRRKLSVQIELEFAKRGTHGELVSASTNEPTGNTYDYTLDYINIQALIFYKLGFQRRARYFAGPYVGFNYNAKYWIFRQDGNSKAFDLSTGTDIGFLVGSGIEFGGKDWNFPFLSLDFRAFFGLKPLFDTPPFQGATLLAGKNTGFVFVLGIGL